MTKTEYNSPIETEEDTQRTSIEIQPWFQILIRPRFTMKWILGNDSSGDVFILCYLEGLAYYLLNASTTGMGNKHSVMGILLWGLASAFVFMLVKIYIGGGILFLTGRWLKGAEEVDGIRSALAWSTMPNIWGLLLWIPAFVFLQEELFTTATPRLSTSMPLFIGYLVFRFLILIGNIYSMILLVPTLAEAQGFSIMRSITNIFLALMLLFVPVAVFFGYVLFKASLGL